MPVTIRGNYGTRTPAVKSRIKDLHEGPLSYVLDWEHDKALEEADMAEQIHIKHLERLLQIAAGKIVPEDNDEKYWRYEQARSGKQITYQDWAKLLAVPAKQAYIHSIRKTKDAIKFFKRRIEAQQKKGTSQE